jgi:thioredoxin 1
MGLLSRLFNRKPRPGRPRQVADLTFEQEVLASDLPAVVDFYSRTCPPCHVMGGLLSEIGPDYAGKINFYKLDVEREQQTAARYEIRSVPTIIFFHKGKPVDRIIGLMPMIPLKEKLDRLTRQASQ